MDPTINKIYQLVAQIEALTEELEMADEIIDTFVEDLDTQNLFEEKKKWIQDALKDKTKGALHKQMHVKKGEKIPTKKLEKASHKGGKLGKRARLALTLRGLSKKKSLKESATEDFADSVNDKGTNVSTLNNKKEEAITWQHEYGGTRYPSASYMQAARHSRELNNALLNLNERQRVYRDIPQQQMMDMLTQWKAAEAAVKAHPHHAEAERGHPDSRGQTIDQAEFRGYNRRDGWTGD